MKKCTDKLNELNPDIIPTVFDHYWALGNYNLQTADLIKKTSRKATANEIELGKDNRSRIKGKTTYFVTYEGEKHDVCRKAISACMG